MGRPKCIFEVNVKNPEKCLDELISICEDDDEMKTNLNMMGKSIIARTTNTSTGSSQTEIRIDSLVTMTEQLNSLDKCILIDVLLKQLSRKERLKVTFVTYSDMPEDDQCNFFALLGHSMNSDLYAASTNSTKSAMNLNFNDLKGANKSELYETCDPRLRSFINHLTTTPRQMSDNVLFKANAYENLLKARNSKYFSASGIKEHLAVYLSSGKSRHSSQIFSKQGGKSTRPILENILKNSEEICQFKPPKNVTLLFSFDNIQTLLKSHRIGGTHQKKVLAIVVCSILCLMPDGDKQSDVQYAAENAPAQWYSEHMYLSDQQCFIEKINAQVLKDCVRYSDSEKVIISFFHEDLKNALEFVEKDMKNSTDSIDIQCRSEIAKKRKLCTSGHINENVRSNRSKCDRAFCNAVLKQQTHVTVEKNEFESNYVDKAKERAGQYYNITNIHLADSHPKEAAVGAVSVNPNDASRLRKVLDEILDASEMRNKFFTKLVIRGEEIVKVVNTDKSERKWIMVTANGLPYKILIELIKN